MVLMRHVFVEAWAIIDTQDSADCTGNRADCAADHGAYRSGISFSDCRTFLCATNRALGVRQYRYGQCGKESYGSIDFIIPPSVKLDPNPFATTKFRCKTGYNEAR